MTKEKSLSAPLPTIVLSYKNWSSKQLQPTGADTVTHMMHLDGNAKKKPNT